MDAPVRRSSNMDKFIPAGPYLYTDAPGTEPVPVEVVYPLGVGMVVFHDEEGTELNLSDLPEPENWRAHFQRVAGA